MKVILTALVGIETQDKEVENGYRYLVAKFVLECRNMYPQQTPGKIRVFYFIPKKKPKPNKDNCLTDKSVEQTSYSSSSPF